MPPPRKFKWSLRNNVNYQQSGCLAALDYSAKNAKEMLRISTARATTPGRGASRRAVRVPIPADQGDRRRVADMVELLLAHRIEVAGGRAVQGRGRGVPGRDLCRAPRPALPRLCRGPAHAAVFPPDATYEPYDDVSWALPVHYGLEAKRIDDAKIAEAKLEPLQPGFGVTRARRRRPLGPSIPQGRGQEGLLALRARLAGFRVEIAEKPFKSGDKDYPPARGSSPTRRGSAKRSGRRG